MTSLFEAYYNPETARKREEERDRFIHSDEHKNMWIEKDYPEEFLAEYFSHEWNMGKNEIEAIINRVKSEQA